MESSRVRKAGLSLGATAVGVGVVMQVPMFLAARKHHYRLVGMAMDHWMIAGMGLILIGLVAVVVTLTPPRRLDLGATRSLSVAPLDDTKMGPAHLGMLGVLTLAIAIDSQKPFTFAFILPGVASEYNLSSPGHHVAGAAPVALIALVGIAGTVVGSLVWGYVADRWGRRSAILIAAMIFLATCACGAMPAFSDNLVMCFVMGLGAGGLLPIAYTLLAETIPARHRGQVVVLVAGVGTAAGFLLAS
ncbi:MAG: MFS transporter, partial [Acidimicrobiales bacterium]